jgi:hypothetical protein
MQSMPNIEQWSSTWGTRTPGRTRKYLTVYVKVKEILLHDKHIIIGADLGLATDTRT